MYVKCHLLGNDNAGECIFIVEYIRRHGHVDVSFSPVCERNHVIQA